MLSTELARYNDQLDQLAGEVAVLRNREAIVQAELDRVKAQLRREKDRLEQLQDGAARARSTCSAGGWSRSTAPTSPTCSP